MKPMKSLLFAILLAPALAVAQPKTADDWYKEGETQYNLGKFDAAAEAFKQGYAAESDESKKSAYLYNVAQAYRMGNKCKDAAFFYKRYLSLKDRDTAKPLRAEKRAEIEQRIAELDECARTQAQIAAKPPSNTLPPEPGTGTTTPGTTNPGTTTPGANTATPTGPTVAQREVEAPDPADDDGGSVTAWATHPPKLISARFIGGGSVVTAGDLDIGLRATLGLTAGYPVFAKDKLHVEAGAHFSFTPIPFRNDFTGGSGLASLVGLLANGSATYAVAPKIGVRGDLGIGVLSMAGISEMGNPFTENGAATSGALAMFALRVAASADYEITPNLIGTVTPLAFSYSPAKAGLRNDISAITRIDFMLGIGYRM